MTIIPKAWRSVAQLASAGLVPFGAEFSLPDHARQPISVKSVIKNRSGGPARTVSDARRGRLF